MSKIKGQVNPFLRKYSKVALWCVYGHNAFPKIIACTISAHSDIWGYSVWNGVPGYRTLGIELTKWMDDNSVDEVGGRMPPRFFNKQKKALAHLSNIVTPDVDLGEIFK
jgi:hypothetical protein